MTSGHTARLLLLALSGCSPTILGSTKIPSVPVSYEELRQRADVYQDKTIKIRGRIRAVGHTHDSPGTFGFLVDEHCGQCVDRIDSAECDSCVIIVDWSSPASGFACEGLVHKSLESYDGRLATVGGVLVNPKSKGILGRLVCLTSAQIE